MKKNNFRRMLLTFEALADLGPMLVAETEFPKTAQTLLASMVDAVGAREGALFSYTERPSMLASVAAHGFRGFPEPAVVPLLPRHVHALTTARSPLPLSSQSSDLYLSSNGNVSPDLFKCLAPLHVGPKLVGVVLMGRREGDALYEGDELEALALLGNYIALAMHNHTLTQSLEARVSENLRLMASLHTFYDNALEAFAGAIDSKHVAIRGHSLRVGRYAAGIAEALGLEPSEVAGMKAAGYLHDIGKVAVDKHIFGKPGALNPEEFREMADHTILGHQIVSGAQFPWPRIPDIVRWHHERSDGSGYPDRLHADDVTLPVKIMAVADTFDAMTSDRPYRDGFSIGDVLTEMVRITPQKLDPAVLQALIIQIRRDAVGSNKQRFLDDHVVCTVAPTDVDQFASMLNHKVSLGRVYSA